MNAKNFLITGLPRSRTAWFAAFMSLGQTICFHEPLKHLSDISELPDALRSVNHMHVGASDSGAGYFLPWITQNLMGMPILVIDRDVDDVAASMAGIGLPMGRALTLLSDRLLAVKGRPGVMWVSFDSLNNKRIMQKIWWHLMPGVAFDEERYELFKDLRIEADVSKVAALAEVNQVRQRHLLRDVILEVQSWRG